MQARKKIPVAGFLLCITACAACTCSRGESRVPVSESLAVDLAGETGNAVVEDTDFRGKYLDASRYEKLYRDPWGAGSPRLVKVGFEIDPARQFQNLRRSLYLGARRGSPCSIAIPLKLARSGDYALDFSLGGWGFARGGRRRFYITLARGSGSRIIFDSRVKPEALAEKRWIDHNVRIAGNGPEGASLVLTFTSDSARPEHLFIGNPRLYRAEGGGNSRPNVIFISVDALRSDAVNCIVDRYRLTPNMDSLARDGAAFTNHFVVSNWTRPSTIAMLASACAWSTGVNIYYPPVSDGEKDFFYRKSGVPLITGLLKKKGYITRSIGNNAFIIDYTGIGVDLDFDELSEYQTQWEDTIDITDEAVSWLEKNRGRRFFLFINYNAPHNGYIPPEKYLAPLRKRLPGVHPWFRAYLGEVAYTDDYLGKLTAALRRLGLYENTIIVLTSDHGEIFSASHEMSPFTDVKAIFSHGQTQLDEELRVPLIIKPAKGTAWKDARVGTQVRNIDIVPTLLDMMGLPVPAACQGRSLVPVIRGKETGERVVYSEGRMMYSVRAEGYKYAERFYGYGLRPFHWGGASVKEYSELFDLSRDPGEERNIVSSRPEAAARMREILKRERFRQPEHTLLAHGGAGSGMISLEEGFFYAMRAEGKESRVRRISRRGYAFDLPDGGSLVFQTIPADAKVILRCRAGSRLLSGPCLLPLSRPLGRGEWLIESGQGALAGSPGAEILALAGPGLCYWTAPARGGLRGVQNEKYLSRDINHLLQKWGYIQGKEKRDK